MNYLEIANSPIVFLLCALVIGVVAIQAIIFIRKAYKRGLELEIQPTVMKKAMTNSAIFSILPTLPIIIMMFALAVPLGNFFAWLRLSIVGSAVYEGTAANIAAQSQGLRDISDPNLTPTIFIIMMFVMTIGIVWGIVFNILFMEQLDKFSKKARSKGSSFVPIFTTALFLGMLATLSAPYAADIGNTTGMVSYFVAGIAVVICDKIAKKTNKRLLSDFSLPIALIVGMGAAVLVANVL